MSCYFPLYALEQKVFDTKDSKMKKKISIIGSFDKAQNFLYNSKFPNIKTLDDLIQIPCGRCIGCRLAYSSYWANRMSAECENHKYNYFVTLTYNDDHLPDNATLVKSHLQNFFKRFRKYISDYNLNYGFTNSCIRYYAVGEYGDKYSRPHYHIIIFSDIDFKDYLNFLKVSRGNKYYTMSILDKTWTYGYNIVSEVSWSTCAYVSRYMLKKQKGINAKNFYKDKGVIPEFSVMSRRPGLAENYFNKNYKSIYECDGYLVKRNNKIITVKPGHYFDNKMKNIDESLLEIVKEKRRAAAIESMKQLRKQTKLSDKEIFKLKYNDFVSKTKILHERSFENA